MFFDLYVYIVVVMKLEVSVETNLMKSTVYEGEEKTGNTCIVL